MLVLPIVDRELRVAARSRRMYLGRVASGVGALVTTLYLIGMVRFMMGGAFAGMLILKTTSYLTWALCLFGGVHRTCDSLSQEKREDTLGLLFLTHLKGVDVVLGKLAAGALGTVLSLLGVLPILSIPVLLGGVNSAELMHTAVVLFNALFLAVSVGLFVSAGFRSQRAATAAGGGAMVFLAIVLPAFAQVVEREWQNPEAARWIAMPSPLRLQELAFATGFGANANDFWIAFFLQLGMGLAALTGACILLPRAWQVRAGSARLDRWREQFRVWTHGTAADRARRRQRLLNVNAWFWYCYRDRFAPLWPFLFAAITLGTIGWCIVHYDVAKQSAIPMLFATLVVNDIMLRMRVAAVGALRLAEDRQSGALEMILSTPLAVKEIIKGQWMAIRRTHLPTYAALAILYVLLLRAEAVDEPDVLDFYSVAAFFALLSIGDFVVLGYVAMWKGMQLSNPRPAAGSAVVRVFLLPCIIWLTLIPLIRNFRPLQLFFDYPRPYRYLALALLVWGTSSLIALRAARRNLRVHFREAATDRSRFEERFNALGWRRRLRSSAHAISVGEDRIDRASLAAAHFRDNR